MSAAPGPHRLDVRGSRAQTGADRLGLALFAVGACAFAVLAQRYWWFVLDDAFVSFRYARNLAVHGELTWNLGEDPVEGYTSLLWVLLHALAIRVGADPAAFAKWVSLASALGMLGFLARASAGVPAFARIGVLSAIALSPPFAVLATQGMETALSCALALACAALSVRVIERRSGRCMLAWYAVAFLAGLARPDSLIFSAGIFIGLATALFADARARARLAYAGLPFLALGLAYMVWRYRHFGHLLPNPSYIKVGSRVSVDYALSFIVDVLAPYLVLAGVAGAAAGPRRAPAATLPTLLGAALFVGFLFGVSPIQGFLWRYGYPILAPILYVCLVWCRELAAPDRAISRPAGALVAAICVLWSVRWLPAADLDTRSRTQADRVAVGAALAGLDGSMYTTESGAPAFFSGWRVVDDLGLNSEEIAHGGSRRTVLERTAPDVVMLLIDEALDPAQYPEVYAYLLEAPFVPVASVHKFGSRSHLYLVNLESALCGDAIQRITRVADVRYGDLRRAVARSPDLASRHASWASGGSGCSAERPAGAGAAGEDIPIPLAGRRASGGTGGGQR